MVKKISTVLVDTLPLREDMVEDTVYVSESTLNATHLDFLGSGEEIMTPFVRGGYYYDLGKDNEISILPEIFTESNQSYTIKKGYAVALT